MDVSIIIVNYNTEKLLLNCIDSIFSKTNDIEFEIIVVDNNSTERPEQLIKDNRIRYIQSNENLGFGKANNLGAQYAIGDYLFLLNPDTLLINNAIKILYDYMLSNNNVGVSGGNLFSSDMNYTHSYGILHPGLLNEVMQLFNYRLVFLFKDEFNKSNNPKTVGYITGADLMIPNSLFRKIGGFNKSFFMYYEETYLCYQVKRLGLRVVNNPIAKIIHLEGKSFKLKKNRENMFYSGRKIYLTKRYGIIYYWLCNIIHYILCLSRLILFFGNKDKRDLWMYRIKLLTS